MSCGGASSSLSWGSLRSSTLLRSSSCRQGQEVWHSAETTGQGQPDTSSSSSPEGRGGVSTAANHSPQESGGASGVSPCSRLMSHISCFLEMLVQPRLSETGWRRTTPLSMGGVTERWRLRSIRVHSRLSQHLGVREGQQQEGQWTQSRFCDWRGASTAWTGPVRP